MRWGHAPSPSCGPFGKRPGAPHATPSERIPAGARPYRSRFAVSLADAAALAQAVVAFCALLAAIWAGVTAKRSLDATNKALDVERCRDRDRAEQAERDQASKIVALPTRASSTASAGGPHDECDLEGPSPAVEVLNRSDLPVYDVTVLAPARADVGLVRPECRVIEPIGYEDLAKGGSGITDPALLDAAQSTNPFDVYPGSEHTAILEAWNRYGRCAIAFTDAAQRRWNRNSDGTLDRC